MPPQFAYKPLNTTIRLLRIQRGQKASELFGEIESFSLDSPNCPKFITVSYVWGTPPQYRRSIVINGSRLEILETLYPFLELISDPKQFKPSQWWWIDSICINQNDREECSSQVQLMGRIYTQAIKGIVWLGKTSNDSDEAINFLWFLQKNRWEHYADGTFDRQKFFAFRDPKFRSKWQAVENLLTRPWWRRVWTLQEFVISPRLEFYCGSKHIHRSAFKSAMYGIWLAGGADGELITKKAFDAGWNRRRIHSWYVSTGVMSLIAMMAYVGDSQATDERDRIYSLLGLARTEDKELVGRPDYDLPVETLYTRLVMSFVRKYKSLDIICFATNFRSSENTRNSRLKLPSWVPNWSAEVDNDIEMKVVPLMASQAQGKIGNFRPLGQEKSTAAYAASGVREPQATFSSDFKTLTCEGLVVDRIDGLGGGESQVLVKSTSVLNCALSKNDLTAGPNTSTQTDDISSQAEEITTSEGKGDNGGDPELRDTIARALVLDREDRYLNRPADGPKTAAELEAFCGAAVSRPETVHQTFKTWFKQNAALEIRGSSLATLFSKPLTTPSTVFTDFEDMSNREALLARLSDTTNSLERRLVVTEQGHVGVAPNRARKGDIVCVLFGCSIPIVLREREKRGTYEFVGECYLHGFMEGQILKEPTPRKEQVETFSLN